MTCVIKKKIYILFKKLLDLAVSEVEKMRKESYFIFLWEILSKNIFSDSSCDVRKKKQKISCLIIAKKRYFRPKLFRTLHDRRKNESEKKLFNLFMRNIITEYLFELVLRCRKKKISPYICKKRYCHPKLFRTRRVWSTRETNKNIVLFMIKKFRANFVGLESVKSRKLYFFLRMQPRS